MICVLLREVWVPVSFQLRSLFFRRIVCRKFTCFWARYFLLFVLMLFWEGTYMWLHYLYLLRFYIVVFSSVLFIYLLSSRFNFFPLFLWVYTSNSLFTRNLIAIWIGSHSSIVKFDDGAIVSLDFDKGEFRIKKKKKKETVQSQNEPTNASKKLLFRQGKAPKKHNHILATAQSIAKFFLPIICRSKNNLGIAKGHRAIGIVNYRY